MTRLGLTATLAITVVFAANTSLSANPADTHSVDPTQIDRWIQLLDHDDFAQREEASRQLVNLGRPAISAVAKAAASDSQEVAWRCGVILQQIGISGDETVMTDVIRAMADLEKTGTRSFKQSGVEIIQRWKKHRDERAVAAVRQLGGEVIDSAPEGFAAGFGGFAPPAFRMAPIAIDGPIIVDFDAVRFADVKGIKVEALDDLKIEIEEEAKPVDVRVEPIKPLALPKLSDADDGPEEARLGAPPADKKVVEKREEFEAEEVERFLKELRTIGIGIDPRSLRVAGRKADRVEDEGEIKIGEKADDVIEFEALEDLFIEAAEPAPLAVPVFDGGFGGGFGGGAVVWDGGISASSSRLVRLGKQWKGTSADLKVLRELSGLATLELHDFELDEAAIKQIAQLKKLRRLAIQNSSFEREKLLALKRANPQLTIYATGKTLLGVTGQSHAEGFVITHVVAGSAAHNAGIIVGDVITQAEGIKLTSIDELTIAIAHKNVGDPLPITFKRDGKLHNVEVKLGSRQGVQ